MRLHPGLLINQDAAEDECTAKATLRHGHYNLKLRVRHRHFNLDGLKSWNQGSSSYPAENLERGRFRGDIFPVLLP